MYTSPKEEERQITGLYSHYKKLFISSFLSFLKEGFSHTFFKWPAAKISFFYFFKELTSKKSSSSTYLFSNYLSHKVRGACPHVSTRSALSCRSVGFQALPWFHLLLSSTFLRKKVVPVCEYSVPQSNRCYINEISFQLLPLFSIELALSP